MDQFYVYLPSNVESIYFENTSANYKTKLSKYLKLDENYQVGLAEISYSFRFFNLIEDEIVKLKYIENADTVYPELLVKKGYYTIVELIEYLNRIMETYKNIMEVPKFEIFIEDSIEKIMFTSGLFKGVHVCIEMSENLNNFLGFNKKEFDRIANFSLFDSYVAMWNEEFWIGTDKKEWIGKLGDRLILKPKIHLIIKEEFTQYLFIVI